MYALQFDYHQYHFTLIITIVIIIIILGTDKDAESLTRLFIYLGFYTNRFDNLKGTYTHTNDTIDVSFHSVLLAIMG